MLNPDKMVFFDKKRKRKFLFRSFVLFLTILSLGITFDFLLNISTSQARDLSFDLEYYYSPKNDKKLALTFDDGPSSSITEQILNILERNNVPGTFFLIGQNIVNNKDLVNKIFQAGNEIGNHSFTHTRGVHNSQKRMLWELNSTNKLIEDFTGHSSILYRPPFLLDIGSSPSNAYDEEQKPSYDWAENLGYLVIGSDIDPKDWRAKSPEDITTLLSKRINRGHIILLHDGDGEESYLIDSLDSIIKDYKSQGYEFVKLSELFGLNTADVMPPVNNTLGLFKGYLQQTYLKILITIENKILDIVRIIILFVILKVILLFLFLIIGRKKPKEDGVTIWKDYASVLIPAYNEEENIEATIRSVLNDSDLVREIIIIDDGSTDQTAQIVSRVKRLSEKITLINKENGGKASALNLGIKKSKSNIIISIDSDTIIEKNSIQNLVKHFKNKNVAAVAGKIKVANYKTILGGFQSIEYTVGQNIEKKAFSRINAVGVIPGAIGAWRKSDLLKCGGYSSDTLVEDQDLTLSILQSGKKIIYEPKAIAYTETPSTIRGFYKQRFRWVFGTIQCFWKYKKNFFSKNYSLNLVILPNIAIYNTFIPLFFPIVDLLAVISIFSGNLDKILLTYNIFTVVDIAYASIAFLKEKKQMHLLALIPIQRIFYRFIIYLIVFKSIIKAIEGSSAFWNKIERTGQASELFRLNQKTKVAYITNLE